MQIDDTISEVQASAAFSLWANHGDRREVEKGLQRALQLDASNATAHLWYSNLLDEEGRTDEGLVEAEKAGDLDPLSAIANVNLSAHYYRVRRYDEAAAKQKTLSNLILNLSKHMGA